MFNKRQLGKEQTVTFYRINGDFERQKKVFDRTMQDLIPSHCGYRSYKLKPDGEDMTMIFVIDPLRKLTTGQQRNLNLLEQHGSVSYITRLQFVVIGEGQKRRLDFEGCFKKPNKRNFDRRALDSLVNMGAVKMTRTIDHFGDFTRETCEGSGFYLCETFSRPGDSSNG